MNETLFAQPLEQKIVLQKVVKTRSGTSCCGGTKLVDRNIVIGTDIELGHCIFIKSKDGKQQKPKNIIPVFINNPLNYTEVTIDKEEYDAIYINRGEKDKPVILTSKNNLLMRIFCNEIENIVKKTKFCRDTFHLWADCIQSQLTKCVYSLQNKKILQDKIKYQDTWYKSEIGAKNRKIALSSLNYLDHMIRVTGNGFNNMKRQFFNIWKEEWDKSNLSLVIKQKHSTVKDQLGFFENIKPLHRTDVQRRNDVDDIHAKINHIYTEFTKIYNNLTRFKAFSSLGDENQLEVVDNLQKIADLRYHIQSITNTEEEFILVGDQSSGKSSLLCLLLGVNIAYTDQVFATRCPVRYMLEPCDPKMGWKYEFEDPKTKKFITVSQADLQKKLIAHFKGTIGKTISFEPLNIKILSPICSSSMTLVDLPGLVGLSEEHDKNEQHKNSYALVQQYLSKPNVFILFVHRFDVDVGSLNTKILDIVKSKHKNNVVYCVTHFDRYCCDKDITYENTYKNIIECSKEVTGGNNMFLLSLSKRVEDWNEKEALTDETVGYLQANHGLELQERNIQFNIKSVKAFLRRKVHKHVLEFSNVLDEYISRQRYIINNDFYLTDALSVSPQVGEMVLDMFLSIFKNKTQKLLKGHLIPSNNEEERCYFETLKQEVDNADKFTISQDVDIWPNVSMLNSEEFNDVLPSFQDNMDLSFKRDLVSHALLTRTLYELKMRLCSVEIMPSIDDIIHGITFDPNINLDTPKDSTHCVMVYTIQRQLDMKGFFDYSMKRLQYIFYKIIRYVLWSIANSADTPMECLNLMHKPIFQAIFELELHEFIKMLCEKTKKQFVSYFDEITSSPIVMSHANRYKEMLINDFSWSAEEIDVCCDESIFKPKNIGIYKQKNISDIQDADSERLEKIRKLIKLHIHIRILMTCEHMISHVDYHWRRMLDDSKESVVNNVTGDNNLFSYIKNHVCKTLTINGKNYPNMQLYSLYNGTVDKATAIDPDKIQHIQAHLDVVSEYNDKTPDLLTHAVRLAGKNFL
jgi:hypothetical protein